VKFDVIIIGGGAAGLFCAIEAGKRGRRTLVIEHNAEVARKILISGGGRCNFTNTGTGPENFVSQNPHFCKSALARYTPEDLIKLVRKHKIDFYEKKLGQLFCRESSRAIVEMLLQECSEAKVKVQTGCAVKEVRKESLQEGATFKLRTDLGEISCESLVIATGGLSFPKIGATSFGYDIAKQFEIAQTATRPALVPLVTEGNARFTNLAGVSIEAIISHGNTRFREDILFTHRGFSGPATLQISNYARSGEVISIDLLPNMSEQDLSAAMAKSEQTVGNFLAKFLPKRFAEAFAAQNFAAGQACRKLSKTEIESIANELKNWQVKITGDEGYHKAEVTLGGVSTAELSSQTMEAKKVPGLYFIGEVVDVTGWLGGYNFQWAWASGYAAGSSA
jgi:predicted Rossmann fold flavoprotein